MKAKLHTVKTVLAKINEVIQGTQYESITYLVGGSLRNELLGLETMVDLDIVVEGSAIELAQFLFDTQVSDHAPVLYERFGTALISIDGVKVELVTARKEKYDRESRKPEVEAASIWEDALRRDFTCNTLLRRLSDGVLIDPLGSGIADLNSRLLRTPLDPETTFSEDPLRMLRAVRFRWSLGFEPAPGLYEAIENTAFRLKMISSERIREEVEKMLLLDRADSAILDLKKLGLLEQFWPELVDLETLVEWEVGLLRLKLTPPQLVERLAALLLKVGGSGDSIPVMLRRLKFSEIQVLAVSKLCSYYSHFELRDHMTDVDARQLIFDLQDLVNPFFDLLWADEESMPMGKGQRVLDFRAVLEMEILKLAGRKIESPLSGDEIMFITRLDAGPEIGELKRRLEVLVIRGEIEVGDQIMAKVKLTENWRNWLS